MSDFWSWYVIIIVAINIVGCGVLLVWTRKGSVDDPAEGEPMGHSFDGIEEYNNPMPAWWLTLFWATIVFGIIYFALYPGLGNFKGLLGWTSTGQWEQEMTAAEENYKPIFEAYAKRSIEDISKDSEAIIVGQSLFANNCAVCHGSDARGTKGYPNLTDNNWLYGGSPATIKTSITYGRNGQMPAWLPSLGEDGVKDMAAYVSSLSQQNNPQPAADGIQQKFQMFCSGCHGPEGKGNPLMGAPNLTDDAWLYGGTTESLEESIAKGRSGSMPSHAKLLTEEKIHVLTAYIYGLSH